MRRALFALLIVFGACVGQADRGTTTVTVAPPETSTTAPSTTTSTDAATTTTTSPATTSTTVDPYARPAWLGTRPLPLRSDGLGVVQPTPPEMVDRQFETLDLLPPPQDDAFHWTKGPVPPDVLARSSWSEECPVGLDDLVYLTLSHYGFDRRFHTGEMIVNDSVADDVITVFEKLHSARFPIEQMRVISREEIDAPPTGDGNETTSFVCRPAVGSENWSQHAYGTGIDINPFQNPYLKGDLVLPELASAYLDREDIQPGMIEPGDVVTEAFAEIGWGWGGDWTSVKDWMHFSLNGR